AIEAALKELETLIANNETTTNLVDNNDGTLTYTNEEGVTQTFDANVVDVTVVSGVYTFTDGTGVTITSIDTNADAIAFDNSGSSLVSTDVEAALKELETLIANNETTTKIGRASCRERG